MPPRRPFGQEDAHHDGLRSSSSRGESGRHGTLGTNKRSPKLEVSFLLNNQSHSAAGTSNGSGEHQRGRLGSQSTASPKSRGERRSTGGSSSGQRRYHCDFCPATFAQSHDLLKHKRFVTALRVLKGTSYRNFYRYLKSWRSCSDSIDRNMFIFILFLCRLSAQNGSREVKTFHV